MRVDKNDVLNIVNRFKNVEDARGRGPNHQPIRHYYAQFDLLLDPFMRLSLIQT